MLSSDLRDIVQFDYIFPAELINISLAIKKKPTTSTDLNITQNSMQVKIIIRYNNDPGF